MEKEGRKKVERKLVFSIVWYATENGEEMRWSGCFLPIELKKKKKKKHSPLIMEQIRMEMRVEIIWHKCPFIFHQHSTMEPPTQ